MKRLIKSEKGQIGIPAILVVAVLLFTFVSILPFLNAAIATGTSNLTDQTAILMLRFFPALFIIAIIGTLFVYLQFRQTG